MENAVSESALNQLFVKARTYNEWSDKTVDDGTVRLSFATSVTAGRIPLFLAILG